MNAKEDNFDFVDDIFEEEGDANKNNTKLINSSVTDKSCKKEEIIVSDKSKCKKKEDMPKIDNSEMPPREKGDKANKPAEKEKKKRKKKEKEKQVDDKVIEDEDATLDDIKDKKTKKVTKSRKVEEKTDMQIKESTNTECNKDSKNKANDILSKLTLNDSEEEKIMAYMIEQNRPYSLLNICDNLRGSIKKKALEGYLNSLVEREYLISKQYNSVVYLINQNLFPKIEDKEIEKLDEAIKQNEEEIKQKNEKLNILNGEYKSIKTRYTDSELDNLLQYYMNEKKEKIEIVQSYKEACKVIIPEEKVKSLEKSYIENKKKYKLIYKTVKDIVDTFSEGLEISRKEFYENYGLEGENELSNQLSL